jgi:hypothetical protein
MGDRANIIVKDAGSTVYLYSHWCGSSLPSIVHAALKRAPNRWDDGPYLARVLFCELLKQSGGLDGETGAGISSMLGDGGDAPDITVSVDDQTVSVGDGIALPIADFAADASVAA